MISFVTHNVLREVSDCSNFRIVVVLTAIHSSPFYTRIWFLSSSVVLSLLWGWLQMMWMII